MKLERLLRNWGQWGRREVRAQVLLGSVQVNLEQVAEPSLLIGPFDRVEWKGQVVQCRQRRALMMHKPRGIVSATQDAEHQTVIDLVAEDWASELHLAGRLDRFTSGLLILTNDSDLSERLTLPSEKLGKRYRVGCDGVISSEIIEAFASGIWFAKEGVTTQPAQVERIADRECLLTIYEGKHHQVKRMFARFGVKVIRLHREAIGPLSLDPGLSPGQWRELVEDESLAFK